MTPRRYYEPFISNAFEILDKIDDFPEKYVILRLMKVESKKVKSYILLKK
jgi:hypothetical protein